MSGPQRLFEALLRLFPTRFRERHVDDMRAAFHSAYAEHRAAGWSSLLGFLIRTTLDLTVSGIRERKAAGRGKERIRRSLLGGVGSLASLLDVRLGWRMMLKHPGLTLVSTVALAVGIPVGLAPTLFVDGIMAPLPVPEGDRIRLLRLWSQELGRPETTTHHDFRTWRPHLSSFEDIAAFRETAHNVDAEAGGSGVRGAEVTASTFEILRVRPILGRIIQPLDETPGAENVAVIGYDLWDSRYAGESSIIGRSIRLGSVPYTVIGVMPKGFLFPKRQHIWTPLRVTLAEESAAAVPVSIIGRLGAGVTDGNARAEFASFADRSALPGRKRRLLPQVKAYAYTLMPGLSGGIRATPEFLAFQTLALVVLLVACANVGMLVFARTAARAGELAVRTALGAGRVRIVTQIFTECLVLAVVASAVGMLLVGLLLNGIWRVIPARLATSLPYWIDWSVSSAMALRALVLAVVSAVVAGIVPAMRFTGRSVQSNIQLAAARRTGVRFGGLASVLIVVDVAVAVAAVGFAATASGVVRMAGQAQNAVGIPAQEYLAATISLPPREADGGSETDRHMERMAITQQELVRRLRHEPGIRTVAVADMLPRMNHRTRRVEAEGVELPGDRPGISTRVARVDIDFFESLGQPILAGRGFDLGDLGESRTSVIVNTTFVERVLGSQNAIGRRIRFRPWGDGEPGPWKEIVGVVGHLGMRVISAENDQGVYEPFAPGELASVRLGIHVGDDPAAFASRLRVLAGEVDSEAIVSVIGPLDAVYEGDWYLILAASLGAGALVGVLLSLAASGIYAIMSFAVSQRTTEIGIRAALGAGRHNIGWSVVKRASGQLIVGVLLGMPFAAAFFNSGSTSPYASAASTLVVGLVVIVLVGVVACTGPTLRALRVHPTEAIRGDG